MAKIITTVCNNAPGRLTWTVKIIIFIGFHKIIQEKRAEKR